MINWSVFDAAIMKYGAEGPFDHCIVDDFFDNDFAEQVAGEFPDYQSPRWYTYDNAVEHKKALNDWNAFPPHTYRAFGALYSERMLATLADLLGVRLFPDPGLHGGGWHIHGTGGNLNPHLDYSIHPKLERERKINIIVYMSREMRPEYGGHLGLWQDADETPGELRVEIEPRFNRAVLFDTTQKSWHGMSRPLSQPEGIYRKSLAVYYLKEPAADAPTRGRALFAARDSQKDDPAVADLIRKRSGVDTAGAVYRPGQGGSM